MNVNILSQLNVRLVNGLGGDPAVLVQPSQSSDHILFDAGSLETLSNRELLRIRVVAISHTHLDHFIGFDRLLRVNVPHFRTLEIVGPAGIVAHLKSKLGAYTWNLLSPGQLNFIVHEVNESFAVTAFRITNDNGFEPIKLDIYDNVDKSIATNYAQINLATLTAVTLRATVVDHGTDVLAYFISTLPSFVVSKEALSEMNLTPGPWISELQKKIASGIREGVIEVSGKEMPIKDLVADILTVREGERVAYVTDMIFSSRNVTRLVELVGAGVDLLICESNFLDCDRTKAQKKFHLTTHQAALLAMVLRAKRLQVFHLSNIYSDRLESVEKEALDSFQELRCLAPDAVQVRLSKEFVQPQ